MNVFILSIALLLALASSCKHSPATNPTITPIITPAVAKIVRNAGTNSHPHPIAVKPNPTPERCLPLSAHLPDYCDTRLFECSCVMHQYLDYNPHPEVSHEPWDTIRGALWGYCNLAEAEEHELRNQLCIGKSKTLCADEFLRRLMVEARTKQDVHWVDACLDKIYEEDEENQTKKRDLDRGE